MHFPSDIVMTYNALRIVSTSIIYRLSNVREWVELAKNARFFSIQDQEKFWEDAGGEVRLWKNLLSLVENQEENQISLIIE